jgi:alanyl-tRNA synthetase
MQTQWTSQKIRQQFLDFFKEKKHKIVSSAPMVNKDDPSLMFTNAGMNQFKDFFLGTAVPDHPRIADTQKCLRVSGKHNDLEEVGRDSYHHTMFEMLGNWSIGDYFKEEAIEWAWELLTEKYGLDKEKMYVTVFAGNLEEQLEPDQEAAKYWKKWLPEDRILYFDKKDNFWEMGDVGPCGPCSEIHYDLRSDEEIKKLSGKKLVNADHPLVVELWNLVFIQFNRKADGQLEELPAKHIDTGMGFERLCMALQGVTSNYATDIFRPMIQFISNYSQIKYTNKYESSAQTDIAMRVVADHIRAVSFAIADGQLPTNSGAGYVIRRILRRAVRYYYSFLDIKKPFLYQLVGLLSEQFASVFPELEAQKDQVATIIEAEEKSFLNTLETGLKRFAEIHPENNCVTGKIAFELYDTFGFPMDLTRLLAEEKGWTIDEQEFEKELADQKNRSKADAKKEVGDWIEINPSQNLQFVGYDYLKVKDALVVKHRTVMVKDQPQFHLVLNKTPFYGRSGGQTGDTGTLRFEDQSEVKVLDTIKENDLTVHIIDRLPTTQTGRVIAEVRGEKRASIAANHTAAHLMHAALHQVIGNHAIQKGQDVDEKRMRFDFAHFQKLTKVELHQIESIVNEKIRSNIALDEKRNMPIGQAKEMGATMLFGEKYGDTVRVITFDDTFSRELCGGTHVSATGQLGLFKIISESAVAAGIRRIEAITGKVAEDYVVKSLEIYDEARQMLKVSDHLIGAIGDLQEENKRLKKEIEELNFEKTKSIKQDLLSKFKPIKNYNLLVEQVDMSDSGQLKNLIFQLEKEKENAVIVLGLCDSDKAQLMVAINKDLTADIHAGKIISQLAKEINGGGGGQPFFASAGGKNPAGLKNALAKASEILGN